MLCVRVIGIIESVDGWFGRMFPAHCLSQLVSESGGCSGECLGVELVSGYVRTRNMKPRKTNLQGKHCQDLFVSFLVWEIAGFYAECYVLRV